MLLMRVVCKMLMTVLICDGPGSGFQIIGLFANSADAQSYAKDHSLKDWRVAEVISPSAFAESQVATASKAHLWLFSAAAAAQQHRSHQVLSSIRSEWIFWTASHTVRRRRLSSITRAPCRNVMGLPQS